MADQAGDKPLERQYYNENFATEVSSHESRDFKFSYPISMVSPIETQIRKLRHSFEYWKEAVILGRDVLFWKKQWHPTALISGSTVLFMFIWLLDPSLLTLVSLFGLFFTICDYIVPSVVASVFKPESWTARKDQDLDDLCTDIILYKAKLELAWSSYCRLKTTNRKLYFLLTIVGLSTLTWIGCTFNNLFLAYVFITVILLLPGMEHNGIIRKWNAYLSGFFSECLKLKGAQEKND